MDEQMKELSDSFKKTVDEGLAPINEKIGALEADVKAIKETPVYKNASVRNVEGDVYKGRKLSKMGAALKEKCVDNHTFETFKREENIDKFSKFMIDVVDKAVYAEGATATGGALVPEEYQWDMIQIARNDFFMLREAKVVNMNSDTLYLPAELTLPTVEWDVEAGTIGDSEGTFSQIKLETQRMNSLVTTSNELLQDGAIDIVSILTEQLSYGANYELDKQALVGTGSPCSGLFKGIAGTSLVLGTGSANFSMLIGDNFSEAISKLSQGYLNGAKWIVGKDVKHYLRTLKDKNNGYIFQAPSAGQSATLWEYPILESAHCPTTNKNTVAAVFGNLKNFIIGRRMGAMAIEIDPYGLFTTYQTRFRMVTRWALEVGNAKAFVSIVTAS